MYQDNFDHLKMLTRIILKN